MYYIYCAKFVIAPVKGFRLVREMYYRIFKLNVSRDIPACRIYFSYKVLFLGKKTKKKYQKCK